MIRWLLDGQEVGPYTPPMEQTTDTTPSPDQGITWDDAGLVPGRIMTGTVSIIVDFGVFVDFGALHGLIHISELTWLHVNHPSEVLAVGDTVTVQVLDVNRDRQRLSVSLKQLQEDPWQVFVTGHQARDVVDGTVTKIVTFGAFVQVADGVEGLVHLSEIADHPVDRVRDVMSIGDAVRVSIVDVDGDRRRLSLSIKRVSE